jgi:hypothetical protein
VTTPEQPPQKATAPQNRDAEIIALLKQVVEMLDEIDGSLANICGELSTIAGRLP